jgi:hypothetical protein
MLVLVPMAMMRLVLMMPPVPQVLMIPQVPQVPPVPLEPIVPPVPPVMHLLAVLAVLAIPGTRRCHLPRTEKQSRCAEPSLTTSHAPRGSWHHSSRDSRPRSGAGRCPQQGCNAVPLVRTPDRPSPSSQANMQGRSGSRRRKGCHKVPACNGARLLTNRPTNKPSTCEQQQKHEERQKKQGG